MNNEPTPLILLVELNEALVLISNLLDELQKTIDFINSELLNDE